MELAPQRQRWIAAILAAMVAYLATWCEYNHVAFHAVALQRASQALSQGDLDTAPALAALEGSCPVCAWSANLKQSPQPSAVGFVFALFVFATTFLLLRETDRKSTPRRSGARAPPPASF